MTDVVELATIRRIARNGEARLIRETAGLSPAEVAEAIGASPLTVRRWERGDRAPRGDAGLRYARLLRDLRAVGS